MRTEEDFEAALEEFRRQLEEQRAASGDAPVRRQRRRGLRDRPKPELPDLPYSSFPKLFGQKWNLDPPLGK
ncbi:MAG: hypothetical protein GDA53_10790 [Rhodobacteraceae bacterium]|nr:hypothetical protein [Paracoccaceae bacterium]